MKSLSPNRIARIGAVFTITAVLFWSPMTRASVRSEIEPTRPDMIPQVVAWLVSLLEGFTGIAPDESPPGATDTPDEQPEEPVAAAPSDDPEVGPDIDPWG